MELVAAFSVHRVLQRVPRQVSPAALLAPPLVLVVVKVADLATPAAVASPVVVLVGQALVPVLAPSLVTGVLTGALQWLSVQLRCPGALLVVAALAAPVGVV